MAEFDLTSQMGEYLDRHLVFPLLEFLSVKEIYDEQEMLKGKLDLLSNTNMVDFAMDVHRTLYPDQDVPTVLRNKRSEVVAELKKLQAQTDEITKIFEEVEVRSMIETARDGKQLFDFLESKYNFKHEMVDTLYKFAKFQYEIGNYSAAAEYLNFVRVLLPPSNKHGMYALWGKLASEILMQDWDAALEDLNRLKDVIESNTMVTPLMLLEQRTWLIHWSLFVFFNHPKGRDLIIEMFLGQPPYLNAIQTMSPHILRYLTTAVITNKRKRHVLKELVNIIQQESYTYKDPITEFLECLYVNFDFDGAQQKLRDCEKVLVNDFFLVACIDDFIENARLLIFETFIRIHQCISISMLAEKLNMPPEDAERWIVDLIRHSPLDAKIDSKLGHVVMGTNAKSPYQQVIEKTKDLAYKSQMLVMAVEKKLRQKGGKEMPPKKKSRGGPPGSGTHVDIEKAAYSG